MNVAVYETISYAMRYWFIILTLAIFIAVAYISYKEYKYKKGIMEEIDNYAGYIEIIDGREEFIGDKFGITDNCIIGQGEDCEIIIPDDTIEINHVAMLVEQEIFLQPINKAYTLINGRKAINAYPLKTGDTFSVGNVTFRVFIKRTRLSHDY